MDIRNEELARGLHTVVYELVDPRTDEVVYVGQTRQPRTRYSSHKCPDRRRKNPTLVQQWATELADSGHEPVMRVLWQVTRCRKVSRFYEMVRIRQQLKRGEPLLNRVVTNRTSSAIDEILERYGPDATRDDMEPELLHLYVRNFAPRSVQEAWVKEYGSLP